ncbi:MAG: hypothetical protein SFW09_17280 [Hyphomicrobiaceae bacterium]|nr:hypothetical protein [Hyphomicrobiaceae bacterium]
MRKKAALHNARIVGNLERGKVQRLAQRLEQAYPRFCNCFVDRLEDRTSLIQFKMLMAFVEHVNSVDDKRPVTAIDAMRKPALKAGMTAADFQQNRNEATSIAGRTLQECTDHLQVHLD